MFKIERLLSHASMIVIFTLLAGCASSIQKQWREAEHTGTIAAYEEFLNGNPWSAYDLYPFYAKRAILRNLKKVHIKVSDVELTIQGISPEEKKSIDSILYSIVLSELVSKGFEVVESQEQATLQVDYFEVQIKKVTGATYVYNSSGRGTKTEHGSKTMGFLLVLRVATRSGTEVLYDELALDFPEALPTEGVFPDVTAKAVRDWLRGKMSFE